MSSTEPAQADQQSDDNGADLENGFGGAGQHDDAPTGDTHRAQAIAADLRRHAEDLGSLDGADLSDHVEYYQRAHTELQRALGDIDHA